MATFRPSGVSVYIRQDLDEGAARSGTTLIIDPIITKDGHRVAMSDVGDICFAKIDQGTSNEEIISFTGITDNTSTYTLTGCVWGYNFYNGTGSVSANQKKHISGSRFIITNDDHHNSLQLVDVDSTQTIAGLKTFTITPKSNGGNPAASTDLVIKSYVDALVLGTLTTINVIVPATAGETVTIGQLVYFDETDNEWKLTDADTAATVQNVLLGIAQGGGTNGVAITNGVLLQGVDVNQSGLTEGDVQYAGNTAGAISASAGTTEVTVGLAKSATELYFNPRFNQQLTEDQQDALAGTSGTPSATNKYVTNDDTAAAATADKLARRNATGDITVPATPAANTDAASKGYVDTTVDATLFDVEKYGLGLVGQSKSIYIDYGRMAISGQATGTGAGTHYFGPATTAAASGSDVISCQAVLPSVFYCQFANATGELNELYAGFVFSQGGTTPTVFGSLGFFGNVDLTTLYSTTTVINHAAFLFSGTSIYTSTANGSTQTISSALAALDNLSLHYYRIIQTSTQTLFYVDDVLVGTHTTNLPTGDIYQAGSVTRNASGGNREFTVSIARPVMLLNVK